MSAAPVEDSAQPMSGRGVANEAKEQVERGPTDSDKGDAATQVSDSKDSHNSTVGKGNESQPSSTSKEDSKAVAGDKDGKSANKDKDGKEVAAEPKVDMKKFAIHSELQEELDKEISKKPEAEWGATNPAREDDVVDAEGEKPAQGEATKKADNSASDVKQGEQHKEGVGAKIKHIIHHDK